MKKKEKVKKCPKCGGAIKTLRSPEGKVWDFCRKCYISETSKFILKE